MKKTVLTSVFVLIGMLNFATNDSNNLAIKNQNLEEKLLLHNCRFKMYSNGEFIGYYNVLDVYDSIDCSSLTGFAVWAYNNLP